MPHHSPCCSLLVLGACSYLLAGCATHGSRASNGAPPSRSTEFEYTIDDTHPLPSSGRIELTSEDAQVSIFGSDRMDVRIQVHYRITAPREKLSRFTYRVNARRVGSDLMVTEERHTGSRNFTYEKEAHAITIEVPRHAHLSIHEEDGMCAITGIDGRIHLTMDDGDARLENCSGDITIALDDGTVAQTNCATLKFERR